MAESYTDEDMERAWKLQAGDGSFTLGDVATLMADVRRETREATIRECVYSAESRLSGLHAADPIAFALRAVVRDLLALLTPPSAPAEPNRVTAEVVFYGPDYAHSLLCGLGAKPEEPGHG